MGDNTRNPPPAARDHGRAAAANPPGGRRPQRAAQDGAAASGAVLLGTVAQLTPTLAIACNRCERRGRLHVSRLLAQHGANMPMPELLRIVAADCPNWANTQPYGLCGAFYPELPDLLQPIPG